MIGAWQCNRAVRLLCESYPISKYIRLRMQGCEIRHEPAPDSHSVVFRLKPWSECKPLYRLVRR